MGHDWVARVTFEAGKLWLANVQEDVIFFAGRCTLKFLLTSTAVRMRSGEQWTQSVNVTSPYAIRVCGRRIEVEVDDWPASL